MYHNNDAYKHLPQKERWLVDFLGYYALQKLTLKYDTKSPSRRQVITASSICSDGRRVPTVRKHLDKLIEPSYTTNDSLTPKDHEVEKLLAGFIIEPKFNTTGYKKSESIYSHDRDKVVAVTHRGQVYRKIDKMITGELIHVYLNQHLYDIQLFSVTRSGSGSYGSSDHTSYYVKAFPKALIDTIDNNIILAHNETFATEHAREILTSTLGCRFRAIMDDKPYLTEASIEERIKQVQEKQRILQRTLQELRVIKRKAATLGEKAFKVKILDTSFEYLMEQAPIWINSDDRDRKSLAMLILKGTELVLDSRSK